MRLEPGAVRVEVLGSLRIPGDERLARSARLRRLLAALVIHRGQLTSVDRLARAVWGDATPVDTAGATQTLVWRLRTALRVAGDATGWLRTVPPGYLLELPDERLDAGHFEQLVERARARLAGAPSEAERLLDQALRLWHGRAYAEFADEEFAHAEAARLEQVRAAAHADWVEATLALGWSERAVERLQPLVEEHPLWERGLAQLMVALHRTGRSSSALEAFREYRDRLGGELGLDPSGELRGLESAIIRRDIEAEPVQPPAAVSELDTADGNLPHQLTELVGRTRDVRAVHAALGEARLVTLVGVGGVGKTRLALSAAEELRTGYRDGVWLCELAGVRGGTAVADTVASTLGIRQHSGASVTERLVEYLRSRRVLLVLDNCEHVLDATAHLVRELVTRCVWLVVLATSRERLGISGERVLPVSPLPTPPLGADSPSAVLEVPSVRLFVQRAEAATPGFAVHADNASAVAEVCRRLDGLPLAVELAATRVRSMSVTEIAERLADRPLRLHGTHRTGEERHRTLRAVLDWSHQLLSPAERTLFARLSVFAGPFTASAAAEVTGLDRCGTTDLLASLVDKSMLVAHPEPAPSRFALLETLRAYGLERLHETGRLEQAFRAHARYQVELAEAADAGLRGQDESHWADVLARGLDDLRGAHQWALANEPPLAARLSAALVLYGDFGAPSEVVGWAERAVQAVQAGSGGSAGGAEPLVKAMSTAAGARLRGDLAGATRAAERALELVTDPADPVRRFPVFALADIALLQGRLTDAARGYTQVAKLAEAAGDDYYLGYALSHRAFTIAYLGDPWTAVTLAQRAVELATAIGSPSVRAWASFALGEALHEHDPPSALSALEAGLRSARLAGNRLIFGVTLVSAATLHARHGNAMTAVRLFQEAIELWSRLGQWTQQWITLRNVVDLLVRFEALEPAALLRAAAEVSRTAAPAFGADARRLAGHGPRLRRGLGEGGYQAAVARGRALRDDEVVELALAALRRLG